jgi:dienelactone hydrolase
MMKCAQLALQSVFVACALCITFASDAAERFSVTDSISLMTFETPMSRLLVPAPAVSFSPDGAHFVVVTIRGVLSSNMRVATLWLWDSASVRAYLLGRGGGLPPRPRLLLRCASTSDQLPISFWRWTSDSRGILLLRADNEGAEHLEQVSVDSGRVVTVSSIGQDVTGFDENGGHIAFLAHAPITSELLYQAGGPSLPDIEDGTAESLLSLVFPNWMRSVLPAQANALYKVVHGEPAAVLSATRRTLIQLGGAYVPDSVRQKLLVSPTGRRLLATAYVRNIPNFWGRYASGMTNASFHPDTSTESSAGGLFYPQEYVMINIENGRRVPLIDAPIDFASLGYDPALGAWSADESRVAVTGAFSPLNSTAVSPAGRGAIYPCAVAVIDLPSRRFSCPQPEASLEPSGTPFWNRKRVVSLRWLNGDRTVIATYAALSERGQPSIVQYTEDYKREWHAQAEPRSASTDGLRVYVEQALNEPPVLMASLLDGPSRALLDPNPDLKDIRLGIASVYRWTYAGKRQTGVLVLPPDFPQHRPYPLVIQADPLNLSEFLVDGPSHTAFAARALAAQDIVVLQVPDIGETGSPGWMEENAANYRAAIAQLARSGVIDRRRVGIIGFSHSGVFVLQSLEDEPSAFKAASIAEGSSNSYSEFLAQVDYWSGDAGEKYLFRYIGARPWGAGLKVWVARSPGFHTDRICAPILEQANDAATLVFLSWSDYAILRAQHNPVDLLYIRNGAHGLIKPRERFVEQTMNVNWFDYWLNERKSSRPAIAGEYRRWDVMRKSLPPCLASVMH